MWLDQQFSMHLKLNDFGKYVVYLLRLSFVL